MNDSLKKTSNLRIFLSHQKKDQEFVAKLELDLKNAGLSIFRNSTFIGSLLEKIPEEIKNCDYFVLVWSINASNSDWVKRELEVSIEYEKKIERDLIIPIKVDKTPLPIELFTSDYFYYDFVDPLEYDNSFRDLVDVIYSPLPDFVEVEKRALVSLDRWQNISTDFYDRKRAYYYIRRINHNPDSAELLINYLNTKLTDEYIEDRFWISIYLGQIGGNKAKIALKSALNFESNGYVRMGIEEALAKC